MEAHGPGIKISLTIITLVVSLLIVAWGKCCTSINHSLDYGGTIKFSRPILVVNDSVKCIYNEGSDCLYSMTVDDDILQRAIYLGEDSLGVLYRLPKKEKYLVSLSSKTNWPNFENPTCVENHYARYDIELTSAKYLAHIYSHFWRDRCGKMYLHAILNMISKANYKDSLPNDFILKRHIKEDVYIAELKTKAQVIAVPDCYWADDDVVKYTPIIIDVPINQIDHIETGINLGDYLIWYAPMLSSKQLYLHLKKDDRMGDYYGYMKVDR